MDTHRASRTLWGCLRPRCTLPPTRLRLDEHFLEISMGHQLCREEAPLGRGCCCSSWRLLCECACWLPGAFCSQPQPCTSTALKTTLWPPGLAVNQLDFSFSGSRHRGSLGTQSAVPWGRCLRFLLWVLSAGCPVLSYPEKRTGWGVSHVCRESHCCWVSD